MDTLSYKTVSQNASTVQKNWVLVDATNEVVGRLAATVAYALRGKNKPGFTPHVDCGDNVIIINAEKIRFTGDKMSDKQYVHHTGYPGGQRFTTPVALLRKKPCAVVEKAVKGMLPKTRLGAEQFRNLHVYEGASHPHEAQKPSVVKLSEIR